MKSLIAALVLIAAPFAFAEEGSPTPPTGNEKVGKALRFKATDIDGKEVDLAKFQGDVVLFVNVASKCGLTPQYEGLQALHTKYSGKGLRVLGFPANQFRGQEPGTDAEIKAFCTKEYGVTFPMFSKVVVKGEGICDLYKYLISTKAEPLGGGEIAWNFEKVLVGRDGEVVGRFGSQTRPDSEKFVAAIEKALGAK